MFVVFHWNANSLVKEVVKGTIVTVSVGFVNNYFTNLHYIAVVLLQYVSILFPLKSNKALNVTAFSFFIAYKQNNTIFRSDTSSTAI